MAEPTCPAHPNHRPYDATTASVVRLYGYALLVLGCAASIVRSAVLMLLIASVKFPCDPPSEWFDPRAVIYPPQTRLWWEDGRGRVMRGRQVEGVAGEVVGDDIQTEGLVDMEDRASGDTCSVSDARASLCTA